MRFRTQKEVQSGADDGIFNPMKLAAALENKSSHPLANAIVSEFCGCIAEMKTPLPASKNIHVIEGVGVEGFVEYKSGEFVHVVIGNDNVLEDFVSFKQSEVRPLK